MMTGCHNRTQEACVHAVHCAESSEGDIGSPHQVDAKQTEMGKPRLSHFLKLLGSAGEVKDNPKEDKVQAIALFGVLALTRLRLGHRLD